MIFNRTWVFPSPNTFSMKPIRSLLDRYIHSGKLVLDPFARNASIATSTNDINPDTTAMYHMEAVDFVDLMLRHGHQYDVALLDPPYSVRQLKECYDIVGRKLTQRDTQYSPMLNEVKDRIHKMLKDDGYVISFGWNSVGMGINRGYEIVEILLCSHGGIHNDTIVTVEKKRSLNISVINNSVCRLPENGLKVTQQEAEPDSERIALPTS